jgi:hypothetical protein
MGRTYYAYNCANANEQIAFNWGTDYTYAGAGATVTTVPRSSDGHLLPPPVGSGQCAGSDKKGVVYAQVAISGVSCSVAESVMTGSDAAKGSSTKRTASPAPRRVKGHTPTGRVRGAAPTTPMTA